MKTLVTGMAMVLAIGALLSACAHGEDGPVPMNGDIAAHPDLAPLATSVTAKPLADSLGPRIVEFGQASQKMHLRFGAGESADFVSAALAHAGAKPGEFGEYRNFAWGVPVGGVDAILPGDIIQFEECRFVDRRNWRNLNHQSAIVESVDGMSVVLLHQNARFGGPVVRETLDLSWHVGGRYTIWRAVNP